MKLLVPLNATNLPTLIVAAAGARTSYRFFEFFTAQIRNPNARRAYARAAMHDGEDFCAYRVIIFVARHRIRP